MHEMAIAASLVEHVLGIARQHDARRIDQVEVEVGVLQQIVPDSLQLAFVATAYGTPAEGAALQLVNVKAVAECRPCGLPFEPAIDDYLCPHCGQADVRIVAGNDIILKSVVFQVPESAPNS
jgi:hydrogenase nickel incorporation protein HypA/HybF